MRVHRPFKVPLSGAAALIMFTVIIGLADAWLVSWSMGTVWAVALTGGAIAGLTLAIAWAIRVATPFVAVGLSVVSLAIAMVLLSSSLAAGIVGTLVALSVFAVWVGALRIRVQRARH